MSIRSEIERISNAISAAYQAVTAKGGTIPQDLNLANLLASIASIKGVQTIAPSSESGSIANQLLRISEDIASSYDICELSGATLPVQQTIANLANTIETIPTSAFDFATCTPEELHEFLQSHNTAEIKEAIPLGATKTVDDREIKVVGRCQDGDHTITCQVDIGNYYQTISMRYRSSSDMITSVLLPNMNNYLPSLTPYCVQSDQVSGQIFRRYSSGDPSVTYIYNNYNNWFFPGLRDLNSSFESSWINDGSPYEYFEGTQQDFLPTVVRTYEKGYNRSGHMEDSLYVCNSQTDHVIKSWDQYASRVTFNVPRAPIFILQ